MKNIYQKIFSSKSWKILKFCLNLFMLLTCFFFLFIDWHTYSVGHHSRSFLWKISYIYSWWSWWSLFFVSLSSVFFIFCELYFLINKKTDSSLLYSYNALKIYSVSYAFITAFIYNFLVLFVPSLVSNDKYSLQSKIEHVIVPSVFIFYFFFNLKKSGNSESKSGALEILGFTGMGLIYPIIYVFYATIYGQLKTCPYFFLDIRKEGVIIYFIYILLSLCVFSIVISVFSGILITNKFKKYNRKYIKFKKGRII